MHDRRREVEARLTRALAQRVRPAERTVLAQLSLAAWDVPPAGDGAVGEPVGLEVALGQRYEPVGTGHRWGPAWGTTWFHVTGEVPADARHPELWLDLGWDVERPGFQAEALVRRRDGSVVKGLNPQNSWLPAEPGAAVDLWVEAAANPRLLGPDWFRPTDEGDRLTSSPDPLYAVRAAQVCERHDEVVALGHDLEVLDGLMRTLPDDDARRWELVVALERALDLLDHGDVAATARRSRAALAEVLAAPARASAHRVSAVGHAHIDSAWLWPVRETVRKVLRTVANVVHLLDTRDDLVYAMSSAQQWEWVRVHDPALFERVREHVRAGRFVPVGGMWVESDTNMVGGEAMARQLVAGQGWFERHLGTTCEEVWLPDSFGYTAALPQLLRLAGCRWFLTQKISWNTVNHFPHHTFWWEGIDGTRVFTHFPPVDTYTSELTGAELAHAAASFRDKGAARRSLVPFGHGDGGGGPTREMLERASRTADLEGSPRVTVESPAAFFERAHEEYAAAPTWVGELYLEMHRGTYTSQALSKRGNRRAEHLLREAELWSATAAVRGLLPYPADVLRAAWETVLLHQFHDILPGSSIAWVHREAAATYESVHADLEQVVAAATTALAGAGEVPLGFDAGPFGRDGAPALGAGLLDVRGTTTPLADGNDLVLDNGLLRVVVGPGGQVRSVRDLAHDREVVAPGGAVARLELHPDTPNAWDAWDLDGFYRHSSTRLTGEASVDGDAVVVRYAFGGSTATQRIALPAGEALLDVDTQIDWHESEAVLKLAHDLDVHTDQARYETQFGHVTRPTHENTSWDAARFEVCAHRWVHVGETGYGVGVANDSTYGHDVSRHPRDGGGTSSTVRLTLLRAPRYPDPRTDRGRHVLGCTLAPGAGVGGAVHAGYRRNLPVRRVRGAGPVEPLLRVDGASVVVEAVKLAEDGSGDVVVRLYEPLGARAAATLVPSFRVASVTETDLLERPLERDALVGADDGVASLRLRPFQVVTLRLAVAS